MRGAENDLCRRDPRVVIAVNGFTHLIYSREWGMVVV
jgi:hypothetical protein